jgi:hypothetical protein
VTALPALLTQVKEAVGAIGKTDTNRQQGFNFRGIDAVINAVAPALIDAGVIVVPNVRTYEHGTVEVGGKRTPMGHARVVVEYTFYGPDGDTIMCSAPGEAMDSGDKATAKAMSVAYRTALLQALSLPTTEADPDATTYQRTDTMELTRARVRVQSTWAAQFPGRSPNDIPTDFGSRYGTDINLASAEELNAYAEALGAPAPAAPPSTQEQLQRATTAPSSGQSEEAKA